MEQENRKYIAIISFLRKFISVFFSIFFNVYILKIVNNDLNFIIKYNLFGVVADFIFCYLILKIINSKNAGRIYKISFPLLILSIFLLIIFKEKIVKHIFVFKMLERLATVCYSVPFELIVIGSNTNKTMSSYIANINILIGIATILTPVFSGFIIQKFSYYMLFMILAIEGLLIIYISSKIKDFTVSDKKLELKEFIKIAKQKRHIKDIYKCMFYRRISLQGIVVELLPVVLFMRLGTELQLGKYNSIFAVISIVSLKVLKKINNKHVKKTFYHYLAIVVFLSSILVVFDSSLTTLLIFYILMNSFGQIIESESCSIVYSAIKVDGLVKYKKEHMLIYNFYMLLGQIISYILVYLLYNYLYSLNILSISISLLMFFLIVSTIYLNRTEEYLEHI